MWVLLSVGFSLLASLSSTDRYSSCWRSDVIGAGEPTSRHTFRALQSSFLPLLLVVIGATQNAPDVNHSPPVFDRGNQPASVVAYIEHHKGPGDIRISPTVADKAWRV
jgi:hypothetical protein